MNLHKCVTFFTLREIILENKRGGWNDDLSGVKAPNFR